MCGCLSVSTRLFYQGKGHYTNVYCMSLWRKKNEISVHCIWYCKKICFKILNLMYFFYSKYKNGRCLNWWSLFLFKHLGVYKTLFMYCFQFSNSNVWYTHPCTLSLCLLSLNEEGPFWSHELHGVSLCFSIQLENNLTHFLILYCIHTFSAIHIHWFSTVKLLELLT